MPATPSIMLPLGTPAPDFDLPDPSGRRWTLADFADAPGLVVMFLCNHCPFVVHIREKLAEVAREYGEKGIAFVAINPNDIENFPDDAPDKMAEIAREFGFTFPYLFDESQETAKKYRAACTPDFFFFDRDRKLIYRGQFDESRPGNGVPVTGSHLKAAMDAFLAGEPVTVEQVPSIGCNIKWKKGNEPDYA
jgi:thiol-disulfide isomerase/thioredoxin